MEDSRAGRCKGPEAGRRKITRNREEHKERTGVGVWGVLDVKGGLGSRVVNGCL